MDPVFEFHVLAQQTSFALVGLSLLDQNMGTVNYSNHVQSEDKRE